MSNNELKAKLSGIFVAMVGCFTLMQPLSAAAQNLANSSVNSARKAVVNKTDDAYTEMLGLVKPLTELVFLISQINNRLASNDEELMQRVAANNKFPNLVNALTNVLNDINSIEKTDSELLDAKDKQLLEFIASGVREVRFNADKIAKRIKQSTFIPEYFESEVTDDDLLAIAEHLESVS